MLVSPSSPRLKLTGFRDGKSNYMEGLMLFTLYLVIALACKLSMSAVDHILIAFQFGWRDVRAVGDCFAFRD